MAYNHPGVVIDDGTQNRFMRFSVNQNLRAMHEVTHPKVIDTIYLEAFADIPALIAKPEQLFFFYNPKQGIVMNGRSADQSLLGKFFVQIFNGDIRKGLTFNPDGGNHFRRYLSGPSLIVAHFWFQAIEAFLFIGFEP